MINLQEVLKEYEFKIKSINKDINAYKNLVEESEIKKQLFEGIIDKLKLMIKENE